MSHKLVSLYIGDSEYYTRTDADAVIAEKDAKILALDAEVFKQKHHAKLFLDERNYAETQLRHHKYKRCLAMAKWCKLEQERIELIECQDITDDDFNKLVKGFYKKWHKRWLKLAEKFKPNSTDKQVKGKQNE